MKDKYEKISWDLLGYFIEKQSYLLDWERWLKNYELGQ